uniref:Uncharacterized protein n=1 Tax=Accipiter nisus TaxID=211598 RepID=A0A8B9MAA6_9AVES
MGDAGMEPNISPPDNSAQQDSAFSMMDLFLISLIVGLFTYWFFFRKKKEEVPDLPKMQSVKASGCTSELLRISYLDKSGEKWTCF